jgi:hypothetical protein
MAPHDDDDDHTLVEWAADRDVVPDLNCTLCWGEGLESESPCPCLLSKCFAAFPAAADEAEADPLCRRCDGDGEDLSGEICLCLVADLCRRQEALESVDG